jgi:hypothetical protein
MADKTVQNGVKMVTQVDGSGVAIAPATEGTLASVDGHVHSVDGKITACNTGAVTVAASALPSGAATEASLAKLTPGTPSAKDALSDGALLSAVPVEYKTVSIDLDAGASGWVQLHNAAAIPANGQVCVAEQYAIGPCTVQFEGCKFTTGAYWCLSSTMRTKTITAFTLACASTEV